MMLYLAPLNKLSNSAFRELSLQNGADKVFSEMIRCEKLLENDEPQLKKATIPKTQQPNTILQIICEDNLENIEKSVQTLKTLNPNIQEINYNMGCPQSTLVKNENGAGTLKNPNKIKQICNLLQKACKLRNITPSIKTRIGLSRQEITILETLQIIKESGIKKIYIHGRTLGEPYTKPATYQEIIQAKQEFPQLEIIINGDIDNQQTYNKLTQTNMNGILIGRAALQNPNIFKELKNNTFQTNKSGDNVKDKKQIILQFLKLAQKNNISISQTKANLSYLTKNCISANTIRQQINNINNIIELIELFTNL